MTIDELEKRMSEANEIITGWKIHNDDLDDIDLAIRAALDGNKEAIIEFLKELIEELEIKEED